MGAPAPPTQGNITDLSAQQLAAQLSQNKSAQYASLPSTVGPEGTTRYVQTGVDSNGVPTYTAHNVLTPQQQQLLNYYQGNQQQAASGANALLASANYGGVPVSQAIGGFTSGLTGDMMNRWQKSVQPFFTTQQDQLDTKLRNQGTQPGSPEYDIAMRELQTNQSNAALGASTTFEPQAFAQGEAVYTMPWNLASSMGQFGAPTSPQLTAGSNVPQMQPGNVPATLQAATGTAMAPYQAAYQQYGNMMSGLFGLGSAGLLGLAVSDIRLKENIVPVGRLPNGLGVYRYNFIGSSRPQIGVMAQEVLRVAPDCVVQLSNGYLAVNYAKLLGPLH